ncbi:formate dehydrogenase subunit alpha [Salinithrix halophila]|uniref:Formate dehydrogenase subunit alpha n=1 Tax=Salinithrix halophila TaxID=1485204 RepID=A0ABV8JL14_9BACL
MKGIEVRVNGCSVRAGEEDSVLETILRVEENHPHICYHPALGPIETCDTCIAEVDGRLVRACAEPIGEGMEIRTGGAARVARHEAMDRILKNHELYCTVCDNNNGNCTVHNTAVAMGVEHQRYPFVSKPYEEDHSNPFYRYDPDQCILCGRCVEACQNLQVNETLSIDWKAVSPRVVWDQDVPIGESSCVSCGHCVTVCPCNALMEKSMLGEAGFLSGLEKGTLTEMIRLTKEVEPGYGPIFAVSELEAEMREARVRKTKTVCTYCGVGCSFDVWTKDRKILKVEPRMEAPANQISTCVKGKFGWDFVNSSERLVKPLVRKEDRFVHVEWEEALDLVAGRLDEIRESHGPDAIACIASSKCTNEENYLMQKFARSVIGTNNIDNCSRYCQSPATWAMRNTMGYGGDSGSITDIARADLVVVIGANPAESHPVLSTRIRRAQKMRGQKLLVGDIRKNDLAARADLWVKPAPGTDLVWLAAVSNILLDRGWHDEAFVDRWVEGLSDWKESLAPYTVEYAEEITGVSRTELERVARMIRDADRVCFLWAMGVTQHTGGSETSAAICNLALATGQVGRPGTGVYPLRGHNNVQGAGDFGCAPDLLPGYQSVADESIRKKFAQAWGKELPTGPGYDNFTMIEKIHEGDLKALILKGEEIALVDANAGHVTRALEKLDFLVVQEVFLSETAKYADVVLPASPSLEKEGTFTNTERRIQRLSRVLSPLGDSRPDWEILVDLANRMGADWNYSHPKEILEEAVTLTDLMAGVTWERLDGYQSLQWPVHFDGSDTPLLYTDGFPRPGAKARFLPVSWTEPLRFSEEYDLHLNNGRMLEHFHEGNMTQRVPGLEEKVPKTYVEISPDLARERQISEGAQVRLVSPWGAVKLRAVVTDRVQGKELYIPMNDAGEGAINRLTGSHHDKHTRTPAYKELSVRMEVLNRSGESPMKVGNPRRAHPNPRSGVEVEEKWNREDYTPLVTQRKGG